jgi:pimeloyl-ACP methyl ester carboxylesterase
VAGIEKRRMTLSTNSPSPIRAEAGEAVREDAILPFTYHAPQAKLDELRERIRATRWPEKEPVADFSQGVPLEMMQNLADYWATKYDWRRIEKRLNDLPNYVTKIDGLNIHFIHVRSKHENALPLIVTHGWPGSIIEQLKIIEPLVNPTADGGEASDAFHVVIPSIPGFGFSEKPTTTGWDPAHIACAWAVLMKRLGYTRFVAQGGDWGAIIGDVMAAQGHPELIGIHTNFPNVIPPDIDKAAAAGNPAPARLSPGEKRAYETLSFAYKNNAFGDYMGSRPQTLYGIADSPVGLAAWLLDHDDACGQPAAVLAWALNRTTSATGELIRDEVLDNITLYWLTNTGVSASRLYWEARNKKINLFGPKNVSIPVAVSVFPYEVYHTPLSWAVQAYPGLIHYNQLDKGGHFAAWEQPNLLVEELRAGFKSLR